MDSSADLLIFGSSGHAKVVCDCAKAEYNSLLLVGGDDHRGRWNGIPIIPERDMSLDAWREVCARAFVAIGDCARREWLTRILAEHGFDMPALVHPTAVVSPTASLGAGVLVCPGAVINADACVREGSIVNTRAVIEHECTVGEFAHVSPGAVLCGGVTLGARSWVCAGAIVKNNVSIGSDAVIGAGAAVIRDIPDGVLAVGVPARIHKRQQKP